VPAAVRKITRCVKDNRIAPRRLRRNYGNLLNDGRRNCGKKKFHQKRDDNERQTAIDRDVVELHRNSPPGGRSKQIGGREQKSQTGQAPGKSCAIDFNRKAAEQPDILRLRELYLTPRGEVKRELLVGFKRKLLISKAAALASGR
jgi:hypothetical protein